MTVAKQLVTLCRRPVADEARRRAVLHIVDWLGCVAIGAHSAGAEALWQATGLPVASLAGDPDALKEPSDPWRDLLYEASLGNIVEMDDVYRTALVHPGSVVVPAALFMGRQQGATGQDILTAIVRGYEAMIRFGEAVGPAHYALWHNTATCGSLGAAAAVCSLLDLPPQVWVHAFGHAVTQSAGLWQVRLEPGMGKQWHLARATQTGIQAALYARAGVTGPVQIFEGEKGYFKAKCPDGDVNRMIDAPDDPWRLQGTSFKPWPACRHAHATIDAVLGLREQSGASLAAGAAGAGHDRLFSLQDGDVVRVYSYRDALAFCDNPHPDSPEAARFSLQHSLAVTWLYGPPRLEHFEAPFLTQPVIQQMRDRIHVFEEDEFSRRYPQHFGAAVEWVQADGRVHRVSVKDAWGDPERPMSDADIYDKAGLLMQAAGWDRAVIAQQMAACAALWDQPDQPVVIRPVRNHAGAVYTMQG